MPDLTGQLAIVTGTGASSGLGEATAVRMAELGARVALLARNEADLDRVAGRIRDAGGAASVQPTDLANPLAVVASAEQILSSAEPPMALINACIPRSASGPASCTNSGGSPASSTSISTVIRCSPSRS